ncbi:hypothetical protein pb186bvf_019198 [Paramecium bursaria]
MIYQNLTHCVIKVWNQINKLLRYTQSSLVCIILFFMKSKCQSSLFNLNNFMQQYILQTLIAYYE